MPKPTTPDDDKATGNAGAAPAWLSVSRASQIAGVSKRAMQKRAAAGTIGARKVGDGAAARWEIDGRELSANLTANSGANREPAGREPRTGNREQFAPLDAVKRGREPRTDDRELGANQTANREPTGRELSPEREAELKSETAFLRAQLDEMNAALKREQSAHERTQQLLAGALQMASRQLPNVTQPKERQQRDGRDEVSNQGAANASGSTRPSNRRGGGLALVRDGLKRMFGKGD